MPGSSPGGGTARRQVAGTQTDQDAAASFPSEHVGCGQWFYCFTLALPDGSVLTWLPVFMPAFSPGAAFGAPPSDGPPASGAVIVTPPVGGPPAGGRMGEDATPALDGSGHASCSPDTARGRRAKRRARARIRAEGIRMAALAAAGLIVPGAGCALVPPAVEAVGNLPPRDVVLVGHLGEIVALLGPPSS